MARDKNKRYLFRGFFGFSGGLFCGFVFSWRSGSGTGGAGLEFFHATGGVNNFFFAGIEGVALRTDFNGELWFGGADSKRGAAGTFNLGFFEVSRFFLDNRFGFGRSNWFFHVVGL